MSANVKTNLNKPTIQELFHTTWHKKFYAYIRDSHAPQLEGLKMCWEKDVGEDTLVDSWNKLASWHKCSCEMQSQLIHYKIINRSHWTPCRLKLRDNDSCWRCDEEAGTLVHLLHVG